MVNMRPCPTAGAARKEGWLRGAALPLATPLVLKEPLLIEDCWRPLLPPLVVLLPPLAPLLLGLLPMLTSLLGLLYSNFLGMVSMELDELAMVGALNE